VKDGLGVVLRVRRLMDQAVDLLIDPKSSLGGLSFGVRVSGSPLNPAPTKAADYRDHEGVSFATRAGLPRHNKQQQDQVAHGHRPRLDG
jgi:hypothetical protein